MTTAVQVQSRRGTAAQVAAFTGAQGELVVDTTNNRVVVQDGATVGGWPAAKLSEIGGCFLNKFRNGTMDVWQRGTSMTVTTAGAYTADGWIVTPEGASVAVAQASGRLLTKNSLQVTGAASVTDVQVAQRIESLMSAPFCSQTVTVQAQLYNGTGGAITPTLTVTRPSTQDGWSGTVNTDVNAVSLQPCSASAWTLVSYTFAASADSYNGLQIIFDFGNNFSANTKSIQITECDIRVTPGISSGLNANPPPPELRPIGAELPLCQRYFFSTYPLGTVPGTVTDAGCIVVRVIGSGTTEITELSQRLPNMRTAPTVTWYSAGNGSSGYIYDASANQNIAVTGIAPAPSATSSGAPVAATSPAQYDLIYEHMTASSEL